MTLFFILTLPTGEPTYFVDKITQSIWKHHGKEMSKWALDSHCLPEELYSFHTPYEIERIIPKLHTIRVNQNNRWNVGNKIHFKIWTGIPYKSKTLQFLPVIECLGVQNIEIEYIENMNPDQYHHIGQREDNYYPIAYIDDKLIVEDLILEDLARNDGFEDADHFFQYFNDHFTGSIIHWTNHKY